MSCPGVSPGEMPDFPFPHRRVPHLDESALDALLTGQPLNPDAPGQAHVLAAMLAGLTATTGPGPLSGEAAARSAFAQAASKAGTPPGNGAVWRGRRRPRVRLGLVAAVVAASTVLGGVAAAWADVLPGPIQELAHQVFGAPAASRPSPRSPASVLCSAYLRARKHGDPRAIAGAHARLARAAGGASKIDRYCGSIPRSGAGQPGSKNNRGKANGHGKAHGHGQANAHGKQNAHGKARVTPSRALANRPAATPAAGTAMARPAATPVRSVTAGRDPCPGPAERQAALSVARVTNQAPASLRRCTSAASRSEAQPEGDSCAHPEHRCCPESPPPSR